MRVVILSIFLTASLIVFSKGNGYGQRITIHSQQTLKQLLKDIQKQSGVHFIWNEKDIKDIRTDHYVFDNAPLEEVLATLFEKLPLDYTVVDRNIVIRKSPHPTDLRVITYIDYDSPIILQQLVVSGRVIASDGQPLQGASVRIKGTKTVTHTDEEGRFRIGAEAENYIVEVSYIGYSTRELKVGAPLTDVVISLEKDLQKIEDVVIHTGYSEVSFERSTGAVTVITAEELAKQSGFSLKDRIEGLVPGMYFEVQFDEDQNASLDKSRSIVVRGVGTFANSNPLIVVDGVAFNSDVADPWSVINPDDVESVTVLKDAASASIWGAQAANGVIVIVTKKGSDGDAGRSSLSASVDFMAKEAPDLQKIPWASSAQAIDIYRWAILDTDWYNSMMDPGGMALREYPEVIRTLMEMKMGTLSQSAGDQRLQELARLDVRDEFSDLFLNRLETNQKINLSISQGSFGNQVRTSVTANRKQSYMKGATGLDFTANVNHDYSPFENLTLTVGANYYLTRDDDNGININELANIPQMSRILDESGRPLPMVRREFFNFPLQARADTIEKYNLPYDWGWNLYDEHQAMQNKRSMSNLRLLGGLKFSPIRDLQLNLIYQYQKDHSLTSEYYDESRWYVRNLVNLKARPDGTLPVPRGGMLYEYQTNGEAHNARLQLNYNKNINIDHSIKFFTGVEIKMDYLDGIPYGLYGYDPQSLTNIMNLNFADPVTPQMDGQPGSVLDQTIPLYPTGRNTISLRGVNRRFLSNYANIGYNFRNKLDVTGSIRLDRTNLFGQSATYTHLPQWSTGIGYLISREPFVAELPWVDLLKIRASYGFNGNIDKSASPYIMGSPWIDPLMEIPYTAVQVAPNPALTWEKTRNVNVGVDFQILNRRIQGGFDYYVKHAENVLAQIEVNGTYGYQNNRAALNTGNIINKGVEFHSTVRWIDRQDFLWTSQLNYGTNHNKATKITTVTNNASSFLSLPYYYHLPDEPVDYVASIRWAGYNEEGYPQFHYQDTIMSALDVTNINTLNTFDLISVHGRRNPTHFGRISNSFRYKHLEFGVNLLYKFGHLFYSDYPTSNLAVSYFSPAQYHTFLPELLVRRWQSPADDASADMYSLENKLTSAQSSFINVLERYNTKRLHDAGHIRLQSISLSFLVPRSWSLRLRNARIKLEARDLGPIYVNNKLGIDPEFPPYSSSTYGGINYVIRYRASYYLSLNFGL